ncbi:MAG: BamA/TamA family outer membrane protein [Gemmatimonadota bacterium]|nr:BamA/TamA family outer membrane protein [Gemmatimonadota bacterium]
MTDPRRRLLCLITVVASTTLIGCGAIKKRPVPDPFAPDPPFGQIVREIRLEGNQNTRESVIRDNLVSVVGEPYTEEGAEGDYRLLFQLGVFTRIEFGTEPVEDGIALIVSMDEASPFLPSLSFSITQENGLSIGPSVSSPNLFGRTTKASAAAIFGGSTSVGLRFRDAWRRDSDWYGCCYDLFAFYRDRQNKLDEFDEVSLDLSLQWLWTASDRLHIGPRITWLQVDAKKDSLGNKPPVTLDPDKPDRIPGLGLVAEFDTRNLATYPTSGWYVMLDGSQNGGFLGGSSDYFRLNVDLRRYFELAGDKHSLALYSLTTLTSGEVGVDIPIHQDFHIGGTNTVRGWGLGARQGRNQMLNTAEYWWAVAPLNAYQIWFIRFAMGLQVAAFADVGTAWDTSQEFKDHWIAGGGVGFRLIIPQSVMVRFDLALGEPGMRLAFHVGGGEKAQAQKQRIR